jgi:hypothetical protein
MPGAVLVFTARSRAVDQSSGRNKRDDRLAKGHERVAGTVMVLRSPLSIPGPWIGALTQVSRCKGRTTVLEIILAVRGRGMAVLGRPLLFNNRKHALHRRACK